MKSANRVDIAAAVLSGKWKISILWILNQGPQRFGGLSRQVPGITRRMLTIKLRELERDGLVNRKVYAEIPPRVEYSLTRLGKSLDETLQSMASWGYRYERNLAAGTKKKNSKRRSQQ